MGEFSISLYDIFSGGKIQEVCMSPFPTIVEKFRSRTDWKFSLFGFH
jgi:hypothetical protein